ncbi:MAG: aminotransferase class I/II-fold pyridoxal phosphate-dependent enzyme [Tissierellia bacterium]|nr:aminotransferase class I/II-fold pyridoxal phosphate-dependent enzyme [Tissierellia bacterium]
MEHGGDLLTYEDQYDGQLIDFSSNINPLGMPKGLEEVIIGGLNSLISYPDIKYRKLKAAVAKYLNCGVENVLVGNGAVDIINNIIMTFDKVAVLTPSFSEYELRARVHKKEIRKIPYSKDFSIELASLAGLQEDELLILGNPNNPTGLRIPKEDLLKIYEIVRGKNAFLLLDEAFFEFCPEDYDSIELFKDEGYKHIAIIRAATKFFALPGIRLGYCCTNEAKVEEISEVELPWSVNALADIIGQFIFNNKKYIKDSKAYIEEERQFMLRELSKLEGIKAYNSHTNYILIKLEGLTEEDAFTHFLKYGIVIRKCSSFKELGQNHIRIAIKDRENNDKILHAFKDLLNKSNRGNRYE